MKMKIKLIFIFCILGDSVSQANSLELKKVID